MLSKGKWQWHLQDCWDINSSEEIKGALCARSREKAELIENVRVHKFVLYDFQNLGFENFLCNCQQRDRTEILLADCSGIMSADSIHGMTATRVRNAPLKLTLLFWEDVKKCQRDFFANLSQSHEHLYLPLIVSCKLCSTLFQQDALGL